MVSHPAAGPTFLTLALAQQLLQFALLSSGCPFEPSVLALSSSLALDSVELRDPIQNLLSTSVVFIDHLPILNTLFFLKKKISFYYFNCVHWWRAYGHMNGRAYRDQRSRIPLDPRLQAVVSCLMWVLGVKLRFSGRAAVCALNHQTVSPAPPHIFF